MFRRYLFPVLAAVALVGVGCVPVTEPVGAVEKAEPDKELVGKWTVTKSVGLADAFRLKALTIDVPDVKGNPKGLMRAVMKSDDEKPIWFFITTVGKHTYASVILKDDPDRSDFTKEGGFADWKKATGKQYFIFRYARDGNELTIDCGNNDTFNALMSDSKIKGLGAKPIEYYETPAGWLAKYLDKTGPEKIFDGSNALMLEREKK